MERDRITLGKNKRSMLSKTNQMTTRSTYPRKREKQKQNPHIPPKGGYMGEGELLFLLSPLCATPNPFENLR
jgi:hypothetical protein